MSVDWLPSREYCLALVIVPSDAEYAAASLSALEQLVFRVPHVEVNSEYRQSGLEYVQVRRNSSTRVKKVQIKTQEKEGRYMYGV